MTVDESSVENDGEIQRRPRRKHRLWLVVTLVVFAALAGWIVFRFSIKARLKAEIEAIREAGYPVTCQELDEWYNLPAEAGNAADVILDAALHFVDPPWRAERLKNLPIVGPTRTVGRTVQIDAQIRSLMGEYLADHAEALELLHQAALMPEARYPLDLGDVDKAVIPWMADIRHGVLLLALEAAVHAEDGELDLAVGSIRSAFGVGRSLRNEPLIVSRLVRIGCEEITLDVLERVLTKCRFSDQQLSELAEMTCGAEEPAAMLRGLVGSRCHGIHFFENLTSIDMRNLGEETIPVPLLEAYEALGLADREAVFYVRLMNRYIDLMRLPVEERRAEASKIAADIANGLGTRWFSRLWLAFIYREIVTDLRHIGRLRAARSAIAVQRYRLANEALPEQLQELTPAYLKDVPKDPFDGQPMRYKKLAIGFVAYSIGEDGQDDGGREEQREAGQRSGTYDITFIVER